MSTNSKKKDVYTAELLLMGKKYTAKGDSVAEAIEGLDPVKVKMKAILTVSVGDKIKERILGPYMVNKLFMAHGLMREVAIKNTSLLFDI